MRNFQWISKYCFEICFVLLFAFSNAIFSLTKVSSLKMSVVFIVVILFSYVFLSKKMNLFSMTKIENKIMIIAALFLFSNIIIAIILFPTINILRAILSFSLFLIMGYFSNILYKCLFCNDVKYSNQVFSITYYIVLMIGYFAFFLQFVGIIYTKHMVFFFEPSHFAIVLLPLLLYICLISEKKWVHVAISTFLALIVQNLTLLVGICLIVVILLWNKKKYLFYLAIIVILIVLFIGVDHFSYFFDRLEISSDSTNLSVLVWLSGWERSILNLQFSNGLGIGFNQLGYIGSLGPSMESIISILGHPLCLFDGGSLAPKIISEFGIVGIGLLSYYCYDILYLVKNINKDNTSASKMMISIYIMFSIDLFVRGVGFFAPTVFMFLVSLWWRFSKYRKMTWRK